MTRTASHQISIPANVERLAIEAWETEDGTTQGIIWDRTGLQPQDGEWGTQLIDWEGDRADAVICAEQAGFTVADFIPYNIEGDEGAIAEATR